MSARFIKAFADGSQLEFDHGHFDAWCIYLRQGQHRYAPKDSEYFQRLKDLSQIHGSQQIYADFVQIYQVTKAQLNPKILAGITRLAQPYGKDAEEMDKLLTLLYAGMVAEENKTKAILKKRIKRLGLHQVLLDNIPPAIAAHYSRGKSWRVLDKECQQRGF